RPRADPGRAGDGRLVADTRPAACVPGRFDQQPAHVRVADLADRALPALLARGALGGNETDEAHELFRAVEAAEVADLARQPECSRANLRASRRSVLTRSPGRCGTNPGATTSQAIPRSTKCR